MNVEHQDAVRTVRLQSETLSACYKKEIAELQASVQDLQYQKQLQQQQRSADVDAPGAASTLPLRSVLTGDEQQQQHQHSRGGMANAAEWSSMLERQAAEGSESNVVSSGSTATVAFGNTTQRRISSTSSGRTAHDLIPLDELLNSNFDTIDGGDDGDDISDIEAMPSAASIAAARHRLRVHESRVKHLTTLLAESERDTARLTQLNDALKEEVRRQERSEEREQHLHNLEYLKNVMFKVSWFYLWFGGKYYSRRFVICFAH